MAENFDVIGLQEYVHEELFGLTKKYKNYELVTVKRRIIGLLYNKATLEQIAYGESSFGSVCSGVGDRPIQYFLGHTGPG